MLLSYCPLLVAHRRCRLKPHTVSVERSSKSRAMESTDREGPHRRDWKHGERIAL